MNDNAPTIKRAEDDVFDIYSNGGWPKLSIGLLSGRLTLFICSNGESAEAPIEFIPSIIEALTMIQDDLIANPPTSLLEPTAIFGKPLPEEEAMAKGEFPKSTITLG